MLTVFVALGGLPGCAPADDRGDGDAADVNLVALGASSLTEVLPAVARAWRDRGGAEVTISLDASSKLARQVEAGAPADVVLFADVETMDALDADHLLLPGSRRDLLGNTLVLVVPAASPWTPDSPAALAEPRLVHLALAGEQVPAGRYGRAALQATSAWTAVEGKVVSGDNVRTTLAWVTRGEADAGVVYATDAEAEPGVRTAFAFPADSHPPIVYPAAVVASSAHPTEAAAFLAFCAGPEAAAIFTDAGFALAPATSSRTPR